MFLLLLLVPDTKRDRLSNINRKMELYTISISPSDRDKIMFEIATKVLRSNCKLNYSKSVVKILR